MFPLRDDNPTLFASAATVALIGANVAAWVLIQGFGAEPALVRSICELGAIPGELLGNLVPGTEIPLGPGLVCRIDAQPSWITVFSSMFLHGGWFHLLGNMWFLWLFGDNVEDSMGRGRFVIFYLLCGLAAVAAQMASNPDSAIPMVGASGAIGGVMGAYAVLYPKAGVHMLLVLGFYVDRIVVPAWAMLGYWFLLQIVGGLPSLSSEGGGVAFWAHIGGFAAGVVLIFPFRSEQRLAAHRALVARRSWR
ncbi:MAG: rhomboid family intramembrane serine protease [bacterium]|nr:rhomboid family intramembrane serine protease [bacterium]MCP5065907.1 rhomboid family intramembrane serine protease [bacterium]